jgi:hypothetical protein
MLDNTHEHVVIAVFTSEDTADQSTIALKNWEMMMHEHFLTNNGSFFQSADVDSA